MTLQHFTQILTPEVLKQYQALIFDMDGTLINTLPAHALAWEETGRYFGYEFDRNIMVEFTGAAPTTIALKMMERAGMDTSRQAEVLEYKIATAGKLLVEQATALPALELARLYAGQLKMGIGTGSYRHFVELLSSSFALEQTFAPEHIITAEDVEKLKPDPETWLKVAHNLEVHPETCLVFEDGTYGIIAALACGMDAFDVVHGQLYRAQDYTSIDAIHAALAQRQIAKV